MEEIREVDDVCECECTCGKEFCECVCNCPEYEIEGEDYFPFEVEWED